MKVLVTGASGFIGKNLCEHLAQRENIEVLRYDKSNNPSDLVQYINEADFIYHLAGVNRPETDDEFVSGNTGFTEKIVKLIDQSGRKTPLLITSSIQAELDNAYGKSKRDAENLVFEWSIASKSPVYVYRLPGVFGKWCKPNYNSVVATFCHNIANDLPISISDPAHVVTLTYIDDVVKDFTSHLQAEFDPSSAEDTATLHVSRTFDISLGELADRLFAIHKIRETLITPDLGDSLNKYLYATYTAYLSTNSFSYELEKNTDSRGWLAEFIKSHQFGQIFISKTKPGITRGDHWHHTKIEKFLVVDGDAEITFRNKIASQEVVSYIVSGEDMKVVDIPVGYVHAIKNIGKTDLLTLFWANEILDKERPDTYYEQVKK